MLQGDHGAGARVTGRAAADRVHDEEDAPRAAPEGLVDFLGGGQRLDTDRGELLPHRLDGFGVGYWLQRHRILQRLGSDARLSGGSSRRPVQPSKSFPESKTLLVAPVGA